MFDWSGYEPEGRRFESCRAHQSSFGCNDFKRQNQLAWTQRPSGYAGVAISKMLRKTNCFQEHCPSLALLRILSSRQQHQPRRASDDGRMMRRTQVRANGVSQPRSPRTSRTRGRADLTRLRRVSERQVGTTSPPELADLPAGFWERASVVEPRGKPPISRMHQRKRGSKRRAG